MTIRIRRAELDDCDAICAVHIASIRELCGPHYRAEQIDAWAGGKSPERSRKAVDEHETFVAVGDDGVVVGFGQLDARTGQVMAVYVAPEHIGAGVGRKLVEAIEHTALECGLNVLHIHSSLNAVDFYVRMGFVSCGETTLELFAGLELECVRMDKQLR